MSCLKKITIGCLSITIMLGSCSTKAMQKKHVHNENSKPDLAIAMAETILKKWSDTTALDFKAKKFYHNSVLLNGIANIWKRTGEGKYFDYIKKSIDHLLNEDGSIKTYKESDYDLNNIENGNSLLLLYKVTGYKKYYTAASLLRAQLAGQPRTQEGGFWHKKTYPNQMLLNDLYTAEPFYAEYAANFNQDVAFNDIANQFIYLENHARNENTGLLYHAWDEFKEQTWADKKTGNSPSFWGKGMGWYGVALVDVLDEFPKNHPKRAQLIAILNRFAIAVEKYQDIKSGVWYQIIDKPNGSGNYLESSASSMFIYALAKGVRMGYLSDKYGGVAYKGYKGIQEQFLEKDSQGTLHLNGTVSVTGLGGKHYRAGSYEYYLSEKVIQDDAEGLGTFLLASNEMELQSHLIVGKGKTVMLDNFFNNEFNEDINGKQQSFHYIWNEWDNSGFGMLGQQIRNFGAKTETLSAAPTAENLKNADVYIIVDPDTKNETANPHFMDSTSVQVITEYVKNGGVLLMMTNDSSNAELHHFNELAKQFDIQYKYELKNPVIDDKYEMGMIQIKKGNEIFLSGPKTYLKEISTLAITNRTKAIVEHNRDVIMASAKLGKGTVFAVGDPWLYNEYVNGRKLSSDYQNLTAGRELMQWLLEQAKSRRAVVDLK